MQKTRKIFITGTDTNIGKTYVSVKLLQKFKAENLKTIALKPVATGAIDNRNEDALILMENATCEMEYESVNPFCFKPAISLNIACKNLSADIIYQKIEKSLNQNVDIILIEGAGGWHAPINNRETLADLVRLIDDVEVILVVGLRLGCLNHSILTANAIKAMGLNLSGFIVNKIDPKMEYVEENIQTLKEFLQLPLLEIFDYEHS